MMVCAFGLGVGGFGGGRSWCVLAGMDFVGWGRSGVVCAVGLGGGVGRS